MRSLIAAVVSLALSIPAWALSLDDLSSRDTTTGLKEALTQGASAAVANLGRLDGFLGNERVKIPLPEGLRQAESMMRMFGLSKQADELVVAMNRAAEESVAQAKPILVDAVKKMGVQDAKQIVTGGEDSVTQYFRRTTSEQLTAKFLPIVKKMTAKVQLADKYNRIASQGAKFGLVKEKDANLDSYVTGKALDGLFMMIAEEERKIRKDPLGATGSFAQKVFGALGR